jgi:hypothetical protein
VFLQSFGQDSNDILVDSEQALSVLFGEGPRVIELSNLLREPEQDLEALEMSEGIFRGLRACIIDKGMAKTKERFGRREGL